MQSIVQVGKAGSAWKGCQDDRFLKDELKILSLVLVLFNVEFGLFFLGVSLVSAPYGVLGILPACSVWNFLLNDSVWRPEPGC